MNKVKKTLVIGLSLIACLALIMLTALTITVILNSMTINDISFWFAVVVSIIMVSVVFICVGVIIGTHDWTNQTDSIIESIKKWIELSNENK